MLALDGRLPGKRRKLPAAVFGTGAVGETGRWGGSFEGRPAGRIFGFGDHPSGPPTGPFALMVPPALPSCATPRSGCPGAAAEGACAGSTAGAHRGTTRIPWGSTRSAGRSARCARGAARRGEATVPSTSHAVLPGGGTTCGRATLPPGKSSGSAPCREGIRSPAPGIAGVDPGRVGATAGSVLGEFADAPLIESQSCEVTRLGGGGCAAATPTPSASRSAGGRGRGAKRGRAPTSRFLSRTDMRASAGGCTCTWTTPRPPLA